MRLCYHTYLHWVEKVATCAVCAKQFKGYPYAEKFVGTFPRDKYLDWKRRRNTVASTMTFKTLIYGGEDDRDDTAE